ncbi:MAG: DNA alkylation repair protein [Fimbriimonadaceae bacterium]|nr:DNA alkylation repair protein [Fimbriimonadaceae bacterium]
MTLAQAMAEIGALGDERTREQNARRGAGLAQFAGVPGRQDAIGVKLGDLRTLAKRIGVNTVLARELWATGDVEAMLLATLLAKPKELTADELDRMVRRATNVQLADWLNSYVVKLHPEKEALRQAWMTSDDPGCARAAWSLTAEKIAKGADGLDLAALLDRLEAEMADAHLLPQWTMNYALALIGIHHPPYRERALAIGEKLGVYRDYPVSKGCTSPFAPIWIGEMVRRQG